VLKQETRGSKLESRAKCRDVMWHTRVRAEARVTQKGKAVACVESHSHHQDGDARCGSCSRVVDAPIVMIL
jgi:hypothetical protein